MGYLMKYEGRCGYSKLLQLGSGRFSYQEDRVAACFSEKQMQPYWQAKENGSLAGFSLENKAALCQTCGDLVQVPVLTVEVTGEKPFTITALCYECGSKIRIIEDESAPCPRCGELLKGHIAGAWD